MNISTQTVGLNYYKLLYGSNVLVASSPAADNISYKNHLTSQELLKPFGLNILNSSSNNNNNALGSIYFRTVNKSYQLSKFSLNFLTANEIDSSSNVNWANVDNYLNYQLNCTPPAQARFKDDIRSSADIAGFHRFTAESAVSPWYSHYRWHYTNSLKFAADTQDFLDQPCYMLFIISGDDLNATQTIESMRNSNNLPLLAQRGYYDANQLLNNKAILILHDKHWDLTDPSAKTRTQNVVIQMKKLYGNDSVLKVLEINSAQQPNPNQTDHWKEFIARGRTMNRFNNSSSATNTSTTESKWEESNSSNNEDSSLFNSSLEIKSQMDSNSLNSTPNNAPNDLTFAQIDSAFSLPPNQARGQYLTSEDIEAINGVVGELLIKHVLPSLERRISALYQQVAAVRKGFKNSIKNFFGRRDKSLKSPLPSILTGPFYPLETAESQARQLADLCFIVQDYELAAIHYRMAVNDAKSDKQALLQAAAQEMLALSVALGELNSNSSQNTANNASTAANYAANYREMRENFESAFNLYFQANSPRLGLRIVMFALELFGKFGEISTRINDIATFVGRIPSRVLRGSVRNALLLEQLAYCYLAEKPAGLVRKYAFYLVLAGQIYYELGFSMLGVRCYSCADAVYQDKNWLKIENHLHFTLGSQFFSLGNVAAAIGFFNQLIGQGKAVNSPQLQREFLQQFCFVMSRAAEISPNSAPISNLILPRWEDSSIAVIIQDFATVPAAYAHQTWLNQMRNTQRMTLNPEINNKPLFDPQPHFLRETDRVCVIKEEISIVVNITNPLLIELPLSDLQLHCEHSSINDSGESVESGPSTSSAFFTCNSLNLTLKPSETRSITLTVRPLKIGQLLISGASWRACNSLAAFHPFALPPRAVAQAQTAASRRRKKQFQPDPSLLVPIVPDMPLLSAKLEPIPLNLFTGEFLERKLTLSNVGMLPLHKLCVRVSHPGFIILGKPLISPQSALSLPNLPASAHSHHHQGDSSCYSYNWNDSMIYLGLSLQPAESVELPIYFRAAREGKHNVGFLFRYEAVQSENLAMKFRLLYLNFATIIVNSALCRAFTRPSFANVRDSVLGLELVSKANLHTSAEDNEALQFSRVTCSSKNWIICPVAQSPSFSQLHHTDNSTETVLNPFESLMLLFRVANLGSSAGGNTATHSCVQFEADLSPFSTQTSPLSNLLYIEKALLIEEDRQALIINPAAQLSNVAAPNKFDLILAWRSVEHPQRVGFLHEIGLNCLEPSPAACSLKVHLNYKPLVSHNFIFQPILSVPVVLSVRNTLPADRVTFLFETLPIEEEFDTQRRTFRTVSLQQITLLGRYAWRGTTKAKIINLAPGQTTELQLLMDCFRPGVYNLNRFRFTVEVNTATTAQGNKKPRVFFFPLQHLIHIHSSSSTNTLLHPNNNSNNMSDSASSSLPISIELLTPAELAS
jgi:hypothetical protein